MKDSKTSIKDDFMTYKRFSFRQGAGYASWESRAQSSTRDSAPADVSLRSALPQRRYMFENLRRSVHEVPGHEDVLVALISHCISMLSEQRYLTLEEMPTRRVLPFLLICWTDQAMLWRRGGRRHNWF